MTTAARPTVLIVDDDAEVRVLLREALAAAGLAAVEASDGRAGVDLALTAAPAAILLDINMPKLNGIEALKRIQTTAPRVPVIMLTASDDVRTAVEAMRLGAYDYVPKPFDPEQLLLHVQRAVGWHALQDEVDTLKRQVVEGGALGELMGSSPAMRGLIQRVVQVAGTTFTVLIQGETGSGKELVARAIHQQSERRARPFIAVDCGAVPDTLIESELFGYEKGAFTGADRRREGHFQLAGGGTLFLDEVVNLPLATQAKLLRVLQERRLQPLGAKTATPIDVRIVAACNVPLEDETRAGRFRQDVYYRLNEFTIHVPPLRDRPDDILMLAKRFVAEASVELKRPVLELSAEAASRLREYPWPGNVRELRNVIRRAVLLASRIIGAADLNLPRGDAAAAPARHGTPPAVLPTLREARDKAAADAERQLILWALQATRGNKSEAARLLKTDYKTLHTKVKRYKIEPDFRAC